MTIQDNMLTVFAQCPAGGWHLAIETRYRALEHEINVYITENTFIVSFDCHPPYIFPVNPRSLSGIEIDPLYVFMQNKDFVAVLKQHVQQKLEPLVADVSKYKVQP